MLYFLQCFVGTPEAHGLTIDESGVTRYISRRCVEVSTLEAPLPDQGFTQFHSSAFPKVYSFIGSQVGNVQTAQHIVGRIFLKAYKHHSKAPAGTAATVWVFRIAHTVLIDHWRVDGRHDSASVSIDDLAEFPSKWANPETAYTERELKCLLLSTMSDLDKDDRTVLGLKFTAANQPRDCSHPRPHRGRCQHVAAARGRRLRDRLLERGNTS
jgi:DNA-directed RNA polymerase specialized sigma24 family protein